MTNETNRAAGDLVSVPRDLLQKCLRDAHLVRFFTDSHTEALSALLAAPAEDFRPPIIKCLQENGELIALHATVAQQAELIRLLRAEDVRAMADEPVGKVLSESEMGIGYDRRMGPVIWFGTPQPGLLYRHTQRKTVMPERSPVLADDSDYRATYRDGWNECLDEFERLNKTDG